MFLVLPSAALLDRAAAFFFSTFTPQRASSWILFLVQTVARLCVTPLAASAVLLSRRQACTPRGWCDWLPEKLLLLQRAASLTRALPHLTRYDISPFPHPR